MAHDHVDELVDTVREVVAASLDSFLERAGCTRDVSQMWELTVESMIALEKLTDSEVSMPADELRDMLLTLSVLLSGWAG